MDTWRWMLQGSHGLIAEVVAGRRLLYHWLRLSLGMSLCAAAYGAVLGLWHGPRLAAYAAIKLPLVLLLTAALTVAFSWIAAAALGLPLRFGQVAVLTFLAMATGSLLLLSLAPVAWIFTVCAPPPPLRPAWPTTWVTTMLRPVLERKPGAPLFVSGKKSFLEQMDDVFDD